MDENNDGTLTEEEFLKGCLQDDDLSKMLAPNVSGWIELFIVKLIMKKKQVCLTLGWSSVVFSLCLLIEKKVMAYSDPMVTYSHPKMTYSYPKVT